MRRTREAVELQHVGREAGRQRRLRLCSEDPLDVGDGRVGRARRHAGRQKRGRRESVEPEGDELGERLRQGELAGRVERAAATLEGPSELERVEGVPTRHLMNADRDGTRQPRRHAVVKQSAGRSEAQATDLDGDEPVLRHAAPQPLRCRSANGEQGSDTLGVEAGEREADCRESGAVEPLEIVDCDEHGSIASENPERAEEGRGDRTLVDGDLGRAQEERGLDGSALQRRQLRKRVGGRPLEEVRQAGEGEPGLGLTRTRTQHPISTYLRHVETRRPQRGLPDPRFAGDHDGARQLFEPLQDARDRAYLVVPPHEAHDGRWRTTLTEVKQRAVHGLVR